MSEVAAGPPAWGAGRPPAVAAGPPTAVELAEVSPLGSAPMPTGIAEVDRVLAGGVVPGSTTLLGGEPGTGKSTLLLQALASMARTGRRCLLVAAEESAPQVRRRAARLGADVPGLLVVEATQLGAVETVVSDVGADVVVVDSVQALASEGSLAGSPAQVRECAHRLAALAKALGSALVLVGHVTKDGSLAGPRALEHLVDTVLSFEGDRYSSLRALRSLKHRFGPTGETGLFEMAESGLAGVADPSSLFLGDRRDGVAGSAVAVPVEGHRPLLVEVQALVGRSSQAPRRFVTGLDAGRVGFLLAVLEKYANLQVGDRDVYVSVAGGARACEPAADLAVCLAITSGLLGRPVPPGMVAVGEVGLGGELRRVNTMAKRLAEARRLGFSEALVPESALSECAGAPAVPGRAGPPAAAGPPATAGPGPTVPGRAGPPAAAGPPTAAGAAPAGTSGAAARPAATLRRALTIALGELPAPTRMPASSGPRASHQPVRTAGDRLRVVQAASLG